MAAWRRGAGEPSVDRALRDIHLQVAESTRAARPLCVASGRCCRFEAFGHRLYVTALEAAWVMARLNGELGRSLTRRQVLRAVEEGTCPFLDEGLCTVHAIRPFACRTFFCDPRAQAWQQELHERCHAAVRALHDQLEIPYRYAEWRTTLELLASDDLSCHNPHSGVTAE